MTQLEAKEIAARAMDQINTPFRIHGRTPGVALDCVGLVAYAINAKNILKNYSLKGITLTTILSYMDKSGLRRPKHMGRICEGDVAIVACTPQQFHLMIHAASGWVHSHAGLRKVVHTPGESPWPIMAVYRMIGE